MRRLLAFLLLCLGGPASADIRLEGNQHIGDNQSSTFIPADPVNRQRMLAYPTRFHLSQPTTITAVRLENAISLDGQIEAIWIDGIALAGTLSGSTFNLSSAITLSSGIHTIFPDPGCHDASNVRTECPLGEENDIGFSAMTLVSAQTSTSIMLSQRRTIGDDNDQNDDYEANPTEVNAWYPDTPEGLSTTIPFTLSQPRVLSEVRVYRLREVNVVSGAVTVDGTSIGTFPANLGTMTDPLVLEPGLALAAGNHALTITSGAIDASNRDTFSWDDIILVFGSPVSGQLGNFNAVNSGANAVTGRLTTRRAGVSSTVDLVALEPSSGSINALYLGTVTVQLLDAADDSGALDASGCRSSWSVAQTLGTTTFGALDLGRRAYTFSYGNVLRKARIRVVGAASSGCSTDAFAIRPDSLAVTVSHANASTAGTSSVLNEGSSGGSNTHRAGQPFTIQVRGRNAATSTTSNYDGTVELRVASTGVGAVPGTLSTQSWTASAGTLRTDNARYTEAGTFTLGVRDAEFAIVDAADTPAADRVISSSVIVGRFTPDHFRLLSRNTPALAAACGTFTYIGQPFGFSILPLAEIEAVSASGSRVLNYTGNLFKLGSQVGASSANALNPLSGNPVVLDTTLITTNDTRVTALTQGRARISFGNAATTGSSVQVSVPRATPEPAFDLEVQLQAGAIVDSDGVSYADPTVLPLVFGDASAGNGIAFAVGTRSQRFGQFFVRNGYGSELLPLDLPYGAETFVSLDQGFQQELADSCSAVSATALSGDLAANTSVSSIGTLLLGQGAIQLAAPNPLATGNVTLTIGGPSWLGTDADGNGIYDEPASGQASFGLYRQAEDQIYQRETFQ